MAEKPDRRKTVGRRARAYKYASTRLRPPLFAFVRSGMRLGVGLIFYALGHHHVFTVFAVMAAVSLIATVEVQVAKDIAKILDLSWVRQLIPARRKERSLGPEYPMADALEVFSDPDLNEKLQAFSSGDREISDDEAAELRVIAKRRRQLFRARLSVGNLVAFGTPAGSDEEEPMEIPIDELSKLSLRFQEGRMVSPDGELDYRDVTIREDEASQYPRRS